MGVIRVVVEVDGGCVTGVWADDASSHVPGQYGGPYVQVGIVDWDNIRECQDDAGNVNGGAYWSYPDGPIPPELEKLVWGDG